MQESSKAKTIVFWITTILIVVSQGVSGVADWTGSILLSSA